MKREHLGAAKNTMPVIASARRTSIDSIPKKLLFQARDRSTS
jgi:hypothetical protein